MRRTAWVLVAFFGLIAPAGVVSGTHALADSLGRNFGALAAGSVGFLKPKSQTAAVIPTPAAPVEREAEPNSVTAGVSTAPARDRRGSLAPKRRAPATLGVRVSAQRVLDLARRQAIPQATFVPAQGLRPAGLRLSGVAGLGVGMKDGDVLTTVAGVPATSVAAVADTVIRARARHAPEISAEFWRDGARGALVVEQPYLQGSPVTVPTSTTRADSSTRAPAP